ncbi:phosphatase PAP2 family protein [Corynebacterium striatum]|uniref:Phosphatidic acid phosphatase type 2/haloperoxidase domain-containing protein n=2 Tax=Corynebacterium striatum TaxID=43770 RepID=A0ABC8CHR3_CORST|nr:hypothetical protein A9D01_02995 [Corynebacterium striatum]EGT5613675.1 phosphatase PAP2 family protein [Corynebacterium striatum]
MTFLTKERLVITTTITSSLLCLLIAAITVHKQNSTCWLPNLARSLFESAATLGSPVEMTIITVLCSTFSFWILGIWPTLVFSIGAYSVGLVTSAIKIWVASPRPDFRCGQDLLGFGFPSGHVASSMFILFFVAYMYATRGNVLTKCMLIISWLFATLVSMSRLLLGVHSGADVAGGIGISVAVLSICLFFIQVGNQLFIRLGTNGITFVRIGGYKK